MRFIPRLDTDDKKQAWKEQLRRLFKKHGMRQKDIAVQMARLAHVHGEKHIQEQSFISPLSRFCNGKESSFPGWFEKEEERLVLLAQAIGLKDTDPLWEILYRTTEHIPASKSWHVDFPDLSIDIPASLSGMKIKDLADQILQQAERPMGVVPICHIWGPRGSGKRTAAEQLVLELQARGMDVQIGSTVEKSEPKKCVVLLQRDPPSEIVRNHIYLQVDDWGVTEIRALALELAQQGLNSTVLLQWAQEIERDLTWLLGDCRPQHVLSLAAFVLQKGLSSKVELLRKQWRLFAWQKTVQNSSVLTLLTENWWADVLTSHFTSCSSRLWWHIDRSKLTTFMQTEQLPVEPQQIKTLLNKLRIPASEIREEAIAELEQLLFQPKSEQLFEELMECGLIDLVEEKYVVDPIYSRNLIAQHLAKHPERIPDEALVRYDWILFLKDMWALGMRPDAFERRIYALPVEMIYDRALAILFSHAELELGSRDLIQAWAQVLVARSHGLFFRHQPFVRDHVGELLRAISEVKIEALPLLTLENAHDELFQLIGVDLKKLLQAWSMPQLQDYLSLSPYQFPPRSQQAWEHWPLRYLPAWKVLSKWAALGDQQSALLLSESTTLNAWSQVPLKERISWLGKATISISTGRALQYLILEGWENERSIFIETIGNISERQWSTWLHHWTNPLQLIQLLMTEDQNLSLMNLSITVACELKHSEWLNVWYERLHQFASRPQLIRGGLITYEHRTIPVHSLKEDKLRELLIQVLLNLAEHLYDLGESQPLYKLWRCDEIEQWAKHQSLCAQRILISKEDPEVVQYWIEGEELDGLREALASSPKFLHAAWILDKQGLRRSDILILVALQEELPSWASRAAQRDLRLNSTWPTWISPHRKDVVDLVKVVLLESIEPHKCWWALILHRHEPWNEHILESLKYWMCHDPHPWIRYAQAQLEPLSFSSAPCVEALELVNLLFDYIAQNGQITSWMHEGLMRLWGLAQFQSTVEVLRLAHFIHQVGRHEILCKDGWLQAKGSLRSFLIERWLNNATLDEIRHHFTGRDDIGHFARMHLLKLGEPEVEIFLEQRFLEEADVQALRQLVSIRRKAPIQLLDQALKNRPDWRQILLQAALSVAPICEDETTVMLWMRRVL